MPITSESLRVECFFVFDIYYLQSSDEVNVHCDNLKEKNKNIADPNDEKLFHYDSTLHKLRNKYSFL
jgi:hypothetical protein